MIVYAGQKVFDRRLNNELGLDIDLLGDLVPQVDAKPDSMPFSSKTHGLTSRVATTKFSCATAEVTRIKQVSARVVSKRMVPILVGWKER